LDLADGGTKQRTQIISAPLEYLASLPGKDIRGKLITAFNEWFQIPVEKLEVIKRVIGLLHVASLLYVVPSYLSTYLHLTPFFSTI